MFSSEYDLELNSGYSKNKKNGRIRANFFTRLFIIFLILIALICALMVKKMSLTKRSSKKWNRLDFEKKREVNLISSRDKFDSAAMLKDWTTKRKNKLVLKFDQIRVSSVMRLSCNVDNIVSNCKSIMLHDGFLTIVMSNDVDKKDVECIIKWKSGNVFWSGWVKFLGIEIISTEIKMNVDFIDIIKLEKFSLKCYHRNKIVEIVQTKIINQSVGAIIKKNELTDVKYVDCVFRWLNQKIE